jgi:hypothetical protein
MICTALRRAGCGRGSCQTICARCSSFLGAGATHADRIRCRHRIDRRNIASLLLSGSVTLQINAAGATLKVHLLQLTRRSAAHLDRRRQRAYWWSFAVGAPAAPSCACCDSHTSLVPCGGLPRQRVTSATLAEALIPQQLHQCGPLSGERRPAEHVLDFASEGACSGYGLTSCCLV